MPNGSEQSFPPTQSQTLTLDEALNLALKHHIDGNFNEAETLYSLVLQESPNNPNALHLLGMLHHQAGNTELALDYIHKSLLSFPAFAEAHNSLATIYRDIAQQDKAIDHCQNAIALKPDYADAYSNLGANYYDLNRLIEAIECYHKSLHFNPNQAETHFNLGLAYQGSERTPEAIHAFRQALLINPHHQRAMKGLAGSIKYITFTDVDPSLLHDLSILLEQPFIDPQDLVKPILSALSQLSFFMKLSDEHSQKDTIAQMTKDLSGLPLLLRLMELTPLLNVKVEKEFMHLRRLLAEEVLSGNTQTCVLTLSKALALQCFINEYIYGENDEDLRLIENLQSVISDQISNQQPLCEHLIAILASYRPLSSYPWSNNLCSQTYSPDIQKIIQQQITEPNIEESIKENIQKYSEIKGDVSHAVQKQYEENPYPRWIKLRMEGNPRPVETVMSSPPLSFDIPLYPSPECPQILIMGCGTGAHPITTAGHFANAEILALDLSLSSLAYAQRKTNELNLSNIQFGQADIMSMEGFEKKFDLIECGGVLHHLEDPLAGWTILTSLLKPNGLMKIGLYSDIARRNIHLARSYIKENKYQATRNGIRKARQSFIEKVSVDDPISNTLLESHDFFSLSSCRDLIFHVQEHCFNLLEIEEALSNLGLNFLGFEMVNNEALKKFTTLHPQKEDLRSLVLWHEFEQNNMDTFTGMYQFWCQKI